MSEHISKEQLRHVALLSRLEFSDPQLEKFGADINGILGYFEKLNELDTSEIPPTSHALKTENIFREDEVRPSLEIEDALKNAPQREGNFFKVPKIIQEET